MELETIKVKDPKNGSVLVKCVYLNGRLTPVRYYTAPTGNCQLGSITYVNKILETENPEEVLKEVLSYSSQLILVDVKQGISTKTRELFSKLSYSVFHNHLYESTNGSAMELIIFKKPK